MSHEDDFLYLREDLRAAAVESGYVRPPSDLGDDWSALWTHFEAHAARGHDAFLVHVAETRGLTVPQAYVLTDSFCKDVLGFRGFN